MASFATAKNANSHGPRSCRTNTEQSTILSQAPNLKFQIQANCLIFKVELWGL